MISRDVCSIFHRLSLGLRKVMVRAHRQAWCWQDEWYGLTMEDIRQLELETQLALATKMAQFSQAEEATEANGGAPSPDKDQEVKEAISSIEAEEVVVSTGGETLQPRGVLTKQWSTSSRSSRSSKRGGEVFTYSSLSPPCMTVCETLLWNIAREPTFIMYLHGSPLYNYSASFTVALHCLDPYSFVHTSSHLYLHLTAIRVLSTLKVEVYYQQSQSIP